MPIDLTFPALDGRLLGATVYEPAGAPEAALVVLSALGVPLAYYRRFAAWLAERGVAVWTFDYRGVGASRTLPLRGDPATLLEWARLDVSAAVDHAKLRWPSVPLWGLGHSFGGQAFGLSPRAHALDGALVVAAGSGDLETYPAALRLRYTFLLGGMVPLVAAVAGYIPGRLGIGADLPAGVVTQWARWCRTPGYARGALGLDATSYHLLDIPMYFYDFPDDTFAPLSAAAALRGYYTRADVHHRTVLPEELGLSSIGHFGAFRPGPSVAFWEELRAVVTGDVRPMAERSA